MSENTWEIMKGMELSDVELQMALQCAPVITGVKVSNLLNIELSGYRQMADILKDSDIRMYTLGAACGRVNVFIYNVTKLQAFVQRGDVKKLFAELGYEDMELSYILSVFREKYQRYLKSRGRFTTKKTSQPEIRGTEKTKTISCGDGILGKEWFPHEMGLLLGYPPEDVEGFIRQNGKNALCSGYWKVYEDAEAKKRTFHIFECAEEHLIRLLSDGLHMRDIMGIYRVSRNAA